MIYIGMPNCLKSLAFAWRSVSQLPKVQDLQPDGFSWICHMQIEDGRFPKMSWSKWNKRLGHDVPMKQYLTFIISLKLLLSVHFCLQNMKNQQLCSKNNAIPRSISEGSRYSQGLWQPMGRGWKTVSTLDSFYNVWQHCRIKSDSFIMDSHEDWAWKPTIPAPNWRSLILLVHVSQSCQSLRQTESFSSYFPVVLFWFFQPPWA